MGMWLVLEYTSGASVISICASSPSADGALCDTKENPIMIIRSHRNRFWFRLTPSKSRRLRSPLSVTSALHLASMIPLNISNWLLQNSSDKPNRIGVARRAARLERRRHQKQTQSRMRIAIKTQSRLFLPRRRRIHDTPVR